VAVNFDAVLRLVARVDGLQEIDRLRGAIGGVEGIAKDARRAFTNVTSSATWQAAAVGAAAIGAGLVSSVRVAMDFEQAMSAVAAKTQAGQEDMAKLTDLAKDLGRSTQFSAREVAEGMDFLAMAGFKVNDILTAMPGMLNLAAAGGMDLAAAADIATNVLTGMGLEVDQTSRVVDVLAKTATSGNLNIADLGETFKVIAPIAAVANASLEEMAGAMLVLATGGIRGSDAATGLKNVMLRLAAPPTEAAKALERLGVSTLDADGNFRGIQPVLADVDQAMKDLNLGTGEQLEIQNALFGKIGIASGALLQQAAATGQLNEKVLEVTDSQGAAAEMAEIMNDNLAGAFKRLQSAIEGFQIQLVSGTNPALQGFVDFAANAINVLTDMMERFPLITSAVVALAAAFVALVALAPFIAAFISVDW
jgi:TP901 family phage tail tape measure protein